ncbi:MAG: SDR family NAD(P)-dependent oxidoreductase [Pseudomonadota bacterium]
MSQHLKGKNAVITGASGGIGREVCLAMAREGANLVCNDIGADRGKSRLQSRWHIYH